MTLPPNVLDAIKSGPVPVLRDMDDMVNDPQTVGESVISFAALHLCVGDGMMAGKPLRLLPFQCAFILAVFDNPAGTRFAHLSVASRNGKTALMAVIILSYLIGPMRERNIEIASGAMSRDQAALCYKSMDNILSLSPDCADLFATTPSSKIITGLSSGSSYQAISSQAKSGYGRNLKVVMLDEAGGIVGPDSDFTNMLDSRQGSWDDALRLNISTQAPSDMDYFSLILDSAEREEDPNTVCHLYAAEKDCDILDQTQWDRANPGLGIFRSRKDLEMLARKAVQIPTNEPTFRNQNLNQRVSSSFLAFPPAVWKACGGEIDLEVFKNHTVYMGLDLSSKTDLTAAVLVARDDEGQIHVLPFVFCPTVGIAERGKRDKVPYSTWVDQGFLHPIGGKTMDYDQIAATLNAELSDLGITVDSIQFDKWSIEHFKAACEREGVFQSCEWVGVPQFFKDMGMRLASLTAQMIEGKLRHGGHPVLAMAASQAVAKQGREGISALAKDLSTQRIDPVIALVMAIWPLGDGEDNVVQDVSAWVG